ncbi:MAG: DNA polymerase III subunit delta, partial [Legionellales bacterium RIFCSPHIGHO2_12_FULL_35_11]
MIIKYNYLQANLKKNPNAIYFLIGSDQYLLNESAVSIKKFWKKKFESDENILDLNDNDWSETFHLANSYSLFTEYMLLDIRYHKKILDANSLNLIKNYLTKPNEKCLIIIRAPLLNSKQLQPLSTYNNSLIIQTNPFSPFELEKFIISQLKSNNIKHDASVPELIFQNCQNNMLAAAQAIEKLSLINTENKVFSAKIISEYLSDQSEYHIYDLAKFCIIGNAEKCLDIIKKISETKGEETFVLWILTQEIRLLINLKQLLNNNITFDIACKNLKIWPQKSQIYHVALKRFTDFQLQKLIKFCCEIDEIIKSNNANSAWDKLQQLSLLLCYGWK